MNHLPQAPETNIRVFWNFFEKFAEIFASQSVPPVSTTPTVNFATGTIDINDIGGK